MNKTYKFRIYPNKKQTRELNQTLEICRMTYNDLLSKRIEYYKQTKKTLSCYEQQKYLSSQKANYESMKSVYSQVLQNVAVRVDLAFKGFFRRLKAKSGKAGFPRFKQYERYDSITFPQNNGSFKFTNDEKIYLSKIGYVKIKKHREITGLVKTCDVKKTSTGKWFVSITCINVEKKHLEKTKKKIGIDLGLSEFATFSDNTRISNPKFFKKEEKLLAKSQKNLSSLDKKTKKYKKQKKVVSRIHERISNKRNNFTHQESHKIIRNYDIVCVEDLNVNKMKGSGKFPKIGKLISDVAWREFISKLVYKAEEADKQVIQVNPAYTTQTCHKCQSRQKMSLSDRIFSCSVCGYKGCRDLNASKNILRLGLESLATNIA